jgi:methylglyoxal synthase
MAILYNVVVACNRSTADYIISSKLFDEDYQPKVKDYAALLP